MKLNIEFEDNNRTNVAFRVFGDNGVVDFYTSTRLGGITNTEKGISIAVPDEHLKKSFELKEIQTKDVLLIGKVLKTNKFLVGKKDEK